VTGPFRVIGLDVSLTSTGASDGTEHDVFQTSPTERLEARMDRLLRQMRKFTLNPWAALVVMEGSAYSRNVQTGHEELAALRLMLRVHMWRCGIPVAIVPPSTLKAYTAGHGRASKPEMQQAVLDRHKVDFAGVKVKDGRYDMVDAFALAAMGYARIGHPLPTFGPPPPLKSLLAVDWSGVKTPEPTENGT
jgi:Holliday junction resolvasome RuvABC endonuclease subunit